MFKFNSYVIVDDISDHYACSWFLISGTTHVVKSML